MSEITIQIPVELEDEIVAEALQDLIDNGTSLVWHPEDIEFQQEFVDAAKVLLPYFRIER